MQAVYRHLGCNCSPDGCGAGTASGIPFQGEADGIERANGASSRGFENGSDICIEICAPLEAEAISYPAEDDAGTQRLLGVVVGGFDGAIDKEDEQVTPAAFDRLLELFAGRVGGDHTHQGVERAVELVGMAAQCGVGEMRPAMARARLSSLRRPGAKA